TDASGTAEFVYTGDGGAGTDEIQAWFVDPATMDTVFSNIATKTWTAGSLRCSATITSPLNGAIVCDDSLKVTGVTTITGGFPPFTIQCDVNGVAAVVTDTMFMALVPLVSRNNTLIATCTITDSLGNQTICADTIEVFLDDKPPTCSFTADASGVSGTFFDGRSGIADIIPVKIKNGVLTVEAFTPGDKRVDFHIEVTDPNKKMSFNIEVTDACGNRFVCDPVFLNLTTSGSRRQFEFTFPSRDRYFQVTNHGLSEIRADLNGRKFTLFADAKQAEQRTNAYVMPLEGSIKIDMNPYLQPNDNSMFLTFEGPVGTNAELFISDFGDHVDYTLDLQAIPDKFDLAQNFPNPFNPTTNIRFDVPDQLANGVHVQLRIYNLLGELVRTLMDEQKFPGQYVAEWNGRNDRDESVSSGIYIYQLVAGKVRATKRMLLLR
ncbi:MAG: T9SS type A sorting domain-containing protein, partial [bacterium]